MDTLAHGIVSYAVGQSVNSRVNWRWLVFFGMWPDLFWLPFTFMNLLTSGRIQFFNGPYNLSHSLIIWAVVSALAMVKWRQAFAYTWPWALHILIDVPGHLDMHTPILWPLSNFKLPGFFDWLSMPWFALTYLGFAVVFFWLWRAGKLKKRHQVT